MLPLSSLHMITLIGQLAMVHTTVVPHTPQNQAPSSLVQLDIFPLGERETQSMKWKRFKLSRDVLFTYRISLCFNLGVPLNQHLVPSIINILSGSYIWSSWPSWWLLYIIVSSSQFALKPWKFLTSTIATLSDVYPPGSLWDIYLGPHITSPSIGCCQSYLCPCVVN